MQNQDKIYDNIYQFLKSDDFETFSLGIQLLKSTEDEAIIIKFLSIGSYISYSMSYFLVPLFQAQPELWQRVQEQIPINIKYQILECMPYKILDLPKVELSEFCSLAYKEVSAFFPNFPLLDINILTDTQEYYSDTTHRGSQIKDGIGWSLFVESRYIGPAETTEEEEWIATAHHPDFLIKINMNRSDKSYPRVWLEKVGS